MKKVETSSSSRKTKLTKKGIKTAAKTVSVKKHKRILQEPHVKIDPDRLNLIRKAVTEHLQKQANKAS